MNWRARFGYLLMVQMINRYVPQFSIIIWKPAIAPGCSTCCCANRRQLSPSPDTSVLGAPRGDNGCLHISIPISAHAFRLATAGCVTCSMNSHRPVGTSCSHEGEFFARPLDEQFLTVTIAILAIVRPHSAQLL